MTIKNFIAKECPYPEVAQVSIEEFFNHFGNMSQKDTEDFLLNPENSYVLGKFFYHITGKDYILAYNGWGLYQHCHCTVGASH